MTTSPFEYGSDLHHLWGWGERIAKHVERGGEPNRYWPMIFRDDRNAADAMMRLGIDYAEPVRQIREHLNFVEEMFSRWERQPNEANAENVYSALGDFSKRLTTFVAVMAATRRKPEPVESTPDAPEETAPPQTRRKKGEADREVAEFIERIGRDDLTLADVHTSTGIPKPTIKGTKTWKAYTQRQNEVRDANARAMRENAGRMPFDSK